jgi:sporulation protein YlmC with PRC-barrel domain
MVSKFMRMCAAVALLLAASGVGFAQVRVEVQTQPGQRAQNQHPLRVKNLLGATVNLQNGAGVGTVQDIVLNDEGVVDYLVISDNGKLVTVPWEAAKFNFERRTAIINISPEQYRQIPTYTTERYPDFYTPTYRTQIYRYYGLTPGRERRLERREERRQ